MSDHKRSLCTPKTTFWKDFLSLDIQRAIIITLVKKKIYQENTYYISIYIYMEIFCFYYFSFSFFSPSVGKGCLTIFLKGGPLYCIPQKRPSFFQLCPFCRLFILEKSHWNTFLLRFCERYYDFFVVT